MYSSRVFLALILVAIMAVEVIGYRRYRSDMAAWLAVQPALARLHSDLQREPAARLTVQIAAARALVEGFTPSSPRFPHDHRARLQAAGRGLEYLDIAADGAQGIRNWESMAAYSDVTRLLPRGCDGDHLAFSPALISQAFAVAGSSFIGEAASEAADKDRNNRQPGFYRPLDLAKETAACQKLDRAALRVPADMNQETEAAHSTRWKYRIDISNPTGCLMTPYADDQVIPIPHSQIYRFHLDVARKARLEKVFCDGGKPGEAVAVRVNGQSYDPVWQLDESGINYVTQFVPKALLAMSPEGRRDLRREASSALPGDSNGMKNSGCCNAN